MRFKLLSVTVPLLLLCFSLSSAHSQETDNNIRDGYYRAVFFKLQSGETVFTTTSPLVFRSWENMHQQVEGTYNQKAKISWLGTVKILNNKIVVAVEDGSDKTHNDGDIFNYSSDFLQTIKPIFPLLSDETKIYTSIYSAPPEFKLFTTYRFELTYAISKMAELLYGVEPDKNRIQKLLANNDENKALDKVISGFEKYRLLLSDFSNTIFSVLKDIEKNKLTNFVLPENFDLEAVYSLLNKLKDKPNLLHDDYISLYKNEFNELRKIYDTNSTRTLWIGKSTDGEMSELLKSLVDDVINKGGMFGEEEKTLLFGNGNLYSYLMNNTASIKGLRVKDVNDLLVLLGALAAWNHIYNSDNFTLDYENFQLIKNLYQKLGIINISPKTYLEKSEDKDSFIKYPETLMKKLDTPDQLDGFKK